MITVVRITGIMKNSGKKGVVYSTDVGRVCPGCGHPLHQCRCSTASRVPESDGIVRIHKETKGRKGSGVSRITGIPLTDKELSVLAKALKKKCGSGGTVKNGAIEIQGDHRELLADLLTKQGYRVKLAGG
jgi:translation initiation factor 1